MTDESTGALPRRTALLGALVSGLVFCATPFAMTGLYRYANADTWAPYPLLLGGLLLVLRPGVTRWAGAGLVAGTVAWLLFLAWLTAQVAPSF